MEVYKDRSRPVAERVEDLLSRMTLEEKAAQLCGDLPASVLTEGKVDEKKLAEKFPDGHGRITQYSMVGIVDPVQIAQISNDLQHYFVEHTRLGIPVALQTENLCGYPAAGGTLFPAQINVGSTWEPELAEEMAAVIGQESRAVGINSAMSPVIDVSRDPRWGRSEECFGEDPYLAARMAAAAVRGIQSQGVDVVAKHLCAQGETTGGVNASAARIGPRELREIHLPPVQAAVEAGAAGVMAAYNEIDGTYCHANPWLLQDLLRGEYGFRGFVMSDGVAIDQLDAVTGDRVASGALALNSGVDMGLWDTGFQKLEEAVRRGLTDEQAIDRAARRILTLKFRRGLFENPYIPETDSYTRYTHRAYPQATTLAEHSLVLLKNENHLLPLSPGKRVGLTGPNADALYNQLGDYTPPLRPGSGITPRQGLEKMGVPLAYAPCPLFGGGEADIRAALDTLADCKTVVAVVGGSSSRFADCAFLDNGALQAQAEQAMDCGENVDVSALSLPGCQLRLLEALHDAGKRLITVLIGGRPYAMGEIAALSDALVCAFYPGPTGGEAIAKLLCGKIQPAGRLCVSLPDAPGQLPVYYNAKGSYRPGAYCDAPRPRYSFGFGLSGTTFAYTLESAPDGENLRLTFRVTNTGPNPGWAVPQLYLHRTQGIATSRIRQLCGFRKLHLSPGEDATVTIPIPPSSLTQWDAASHPRRPAGIIQWFLTDEGTPHLQGEFKLS